MQKEKMLKIVEEKMRGKIEGTIDFSFMDKIIIQKIILGVGVDTKEGGCE